jgi:hypothetical protein
MRFEKPIFDVGEDFGDDLKIVVSLSDIIVE